MFFSWPIVILFVSTLVGLIFKTVSAASANFSLSWIEDLHSHADDPLGQGPTQGSQYIYLDTIFANIQPSNKFYVEFGFNCRGGINCGSGANVAKLYADGWRGLLLDGDNEDLSINLHAHYLFHNNIASIFEKYNVPKDLDYLSVDMDSHDIFVLQGILEGGYRPRVISHEYNSNYPLGSEMSMIDPSFLTGDELKNYKFSFKGCIWGASASAFNLLLDKYGYVAVGRVSFLDVFYIRKDILDKVVGLKVPPLSWYFIGFHPHHGEVISHHTEVPDVSYFDYLIEYGEYFRSNYSITIGREKVRQSLSRIKNIHCLRQVRGSLLQL
jgi:hypothetical protein